MLFGTIVEYVENPERSSVSSVVKSTRTAPTGYIPFVRASLKPQQKILKGSNFTAKNITRRSLNLMAHLVPVRGLGPV